MTPLGKMKERRITLLVLALLGLFLVSCHRSEAGFEWGGDWTTRKDYQHFELREAE